LVDGGIVARDDTPLDAPLDPWARFRVATRARIGLERCGDGLPTAALLDFQLAHAHARDAVHRLVDFTALAARIAPERPVLHVRSAAPDRAVYIRRPDLGRRLDEDSRVRLAAKRLDTPWDVVFVIADGLSSAAVEDHAYATLQACLLQLPDWRIGPVVLAGQARVALADEVGALLNARLSVILIGERPGLSVANSLGLYLTWNPGPGRTDAERNCISNIHADGLSYDLAAGKLAWLITEARKRGLSGVTLKEESAAPTALISDKAGGIDG
jgi:ethanolamine ammonia-lyase small subunit